MDDYGLFADGHDTARVDSRYVAQFFGKRHDNVIRDIQNLDCSEEFRLLNFEESGYKNEQGKRQPCYTMTRDGFVFLVMGYRGKKAAQFKELYIKRFNDMEKHIERLVTARHDFPILTEQIKLIHDEPKAYHFSNECDMINRLVTGMSAKQFRDAHGIEKGKSIRPYLTPEQVELMEKLQRIDAGLLVAVPEYEKRKALLEDCKSLPFGVMWDAYCEYCRVPGGMGWLKQVKDYERDVLSKR
jgi:Rha family phage regulatory protein